MAAQSKLPDPQKEILDAFRLSDVEKRGFIMTTEFKRIMTTFGEELPEREGEVLSRQNALCVNQWGKTGVQQGHFPPPPFSPKNMTTNVSKF